MFQFNHVLFTKMAALSLKSSMNSLDASRGGGGGGW